jgi:hypothetical protein
VPAAAAPTLAAALPQAPAPAQVPPPAIRTPLEERARRLADFFNGDVVEGLEDEVA